MSKLYFCYNIFYMIFYGTFVLLNHSPQIANEELSINKFFVGCHVNSFIYSVEMKPKEFKMAKLVFELQQELKS